MGTTADIAEGGARVAWERRDGQLLDIGVWSPCVDTLLSIKVVRLLLPPGWSADARRTWPTLWLLHGGFNDYTFTDGTGLRSWARYRDAIIAIPETSSCGEYADWYNPDEAGNPTWGNPKWETFLMTDVRQILERGYRAADVHAIAGYSMGAEGSMTFPVKYPGMFAAAASLSGHLDPLRFHRDPASTPAEVGDIDLPGEGCLLNDWRRVWGDPRRSQPELDYWLAHDPYTVASAAGLSGVELFVGAGATTTDSVERLFHEQSVAYVDHLRNDMGLSVDSYWWPAETGGHTEVWKHELERIFPRLMASLGA